MKCICNRARGCKNEKICGHAKPHDCIVPAYESNKGMCSINSDAGCFVVEGRCDKWQEAINRLLHRIDRYNQTVEYNTIEYKLGGSISLDDREMKKPKVNQNKLKDCFRKDCDNKRGERGLYCSAECHRIDSN